MRKQLFILILFVSVSFNGWSQSVSFTTVPSTSSAGTVLTVNYKYTAAADSYIYCSLDLLNDWTWVSTVASAELNPAAAGTDVTGSFAITIPSGTTPSASLTGTLNYKISLVMKSLPAYAWAAGSYPAGPFVVTPVLGIEHNILADEITLYPNPVTDVLKIGNADNLDNTSFSIANVLGETVLKTKKTGNNSINVSNLSSGMYILSLNSGDKTQQFKFYKK